MNSTTDANIRSDHSQSKSDTRRRLRFWQQNLNCSLDAQSDLLHKIKKHSIVLIQEPYIDFLANSRATSGWRTVYPTHHLQQPNLTRSLILINTAISTNSWTQLTIPHPDITAILIQTGAFKLRIINMYNKIEDNDTIEFLQNWLNNNAAEPNTHDIFAGDFNRHHPMWELPDNQHLLTNRHQRFAQSLIETTSSMHMVLPPAIPTLEAMSTKNLTRPDNIYCSMSLANHFVHCNTYPQARPPKTDHFPITCDLDLEPTNVAPSTQWNFRETDWAKFKEELNIELQGISLPTELYDIDTFEEYRQQLEAAIQNATSRSTPVKITTSYSKRWFSKALKKQQKELRTLAQQAQRQQYNDDHPVHKQHRIARNAYSTAIRQAKTDFWNSWLENEVSTTNDLWKANRMVQSASTDGGRSRMPEILKTAENGNETYATDNDSKSQAFYTEFFKTSASDDTSQPQDPSGGPVRPRFMYTDITDKQVEDTLSSLKPNKATRPGTPSNDVLCRNASILAPFIGPLFRATFHLQHYPGEWSQSKTIVLRKPGKPDYRKPNAYRPITLSHGLGRAINKCVKDVLQHHCEALNLLPKAQFGARPGRAAPDAVLSLATMIKEAWRSKKVVSALFLDVKGAFPSVKVDKLAEIMEKVRIPNEYVEWVRRRMENRWTTLAFDDFESDLFEVQDGLDQGCPGSSFYWLLYCTELLTLTDNSRNERGFTFVDDHTIAVRAPNFEKTHEMIENVLWRDGGIMDWATDHNCTFGVNKFQLVDFTRQTKPQTAANGKSIRVPICGQPINIREQMVYPKPSAKLLGITIDAQLKWNQHLDRAVKKGQKWVNAIRRLAKINMGIAPAALRRCYKAVAIPTMLYGAETFLTPQRSTKWNGITRRVTSNQKVKLLAAVQRQAGILICGAMRTTSGANIDFHAGLTSMVAVIDQTLQRAAVRLATLPITHPLAGTVKKAKRYQIKRHRGPVEELVQRYDIDPQKIETTPPTQHPLTWKFQGHLYIDTEEDAIQHEQQNRKQGICVYTDGSGMHSHVGAAAILYHDGNQISFSQHRVGTLQQHEVYEGEVVGLILGLHLLQKDPEFRRNPVATIYTDNQAAIKAAKLRSTTSPYLWKIFHNIWAQTSRSHPNLTITIRWAPGHKGIPGNEEADRRAKQAARNPTDRAVQLNRNLPNALMQPIPQNPTSLVKTYRQLSNDACLKIWHQTKARRRLRYIDKPTDPKAYRKLIDPAHRSHISLLTQLRTGHIGLRAHLYRISKAESPICTLCHDGEETVAHFLLHCRAHHDARLRMHHRLGRQRNTLSSLLNTETHLPTLVRYVKDTRRLQQTFHNLPDLKPTP